jgi:hypothetical protein
MRHGQGTVPFLWVLQEDKSYCFLEFTVSRPMKLKHTILWIYELRRCTRLSVYMSLYHQVTGKRLAADASK